MVVSRNMPVVLQSSITDSTTLEEYTHAYHKSAFLMHFVMPQESALLQHHGQTDRRRKFFPLVWIPPHLLVRIDVAIEI